MVRDGSSKMEPQSWRRDISRRELESNKREQAWPGMTINDVGNSNYN